MNTILVVDDDAAITEVLDEILSVEGYRTVVAENGAEGLERARSHSPELVLLDLMMPVMDGWQMLAAMQRDPALRRIPVVVMSAAPPARGTLPCVALLHKPFQLESLLDAIANALDAHGAEQPSADGP
jgi:CheY-like chemotaxis protein